MLKVRLAPLMKIVSAVGSNLTVSGTLTTTTAGSSITNESWHVVGNTGEPAFVNNFTNYAGGYGPLQRRSREHRSDDWIPDDSQPAG
jgi:hypothetical protein